jgi:ubiquinone biosynthesis accessory factor UbiJ
VVRTKRFVMLHRMRTASSMPPLLPNPLDVLPAAINHLLAAEPWARAQLAPHIGKTLNVVVQPFTIRLAVAPDGTVVRAAATAVADTTITLPYSAMPRFLSGGGDAVMRDVRIDGDAEFAQAVSMLVKNLRWDVEEDLSKVVGDAVSHRVVNAARSASSEIKRTQERMAAGITEYLLEENPQLIRPRAVESLAEGVRKLRDDLARLEKRLDRLTPGAAARR